MLFFMNDITDKPDWQRKVHDPNIVAKWRDEINQLDWDAKVIDHGDMSANMFDYVSASLMSPWLN